MPRNSTFIISLSLLLLLVVSAIFLYERAGDGAAPHKTSPETPFNSARNMKIESSAFAHNELISPKYTCDGENINPPLRISEVPEEAKSLVLIMDDPDAPGGTWVHWTVWNIAPSTREIPERSVPAGAVEGMTSFGRTGYGGPCPPSGTHRYFFKLFALDTTLESSPSLGARELEEVMSGHILAEGEFVGLYQRR